MGARPTLAGAARACGASRAAAGRLALEMGGRRAPAMADGCALALRWSEGEAMGRGRAGRLPRALDAMREC